MKKLLFAALAALCLTSTAYAQAVAPHWAFQDLKFRNHRGSAYVGQAGVFNDFGTSDAVDSAWAAGIAKFDTTTSISTAGMGLPASTGSAVDSVTALRLIVFDGSAFAGFTTATLGQTSATAESIYIKAQVSADNSNWFDCAVIPGQAPVLNAWTAQTTVNAAVITFVCSQNTGLTGKMWSLNYYKAQAAAGLRFGYDINHLTEFPYIRWIISGTRATTNHVLRVKVGYISTNAASNVGI